MTFTLRRYRSPRAQTLGAAIITLTGLALVTGVAADAQVHSEPTYSLQVQNSQVQTAQNPTVRPPGERVRFSDPQTVESDLARIDNALNSTDSFSGRFRQYGADGSTMSGSISLMRPGRMRFEYDAPSALLIVSDGVTLIQHDTALETTDRVPLSATPLNYFLKNDVNLARDTEIVGLIKMPTDIRVTARDGSGEVDGDITMVFERQSLNLLGWEIADSFGGVTRVVLSDLEYNQRLDPRDFIFREDSRRERRR